LFAEREKREEEAMLNDSQSGRNQVYQQRQVQPPGGELDLERVHCRYVCREKRVVLKRKRGNISF
jgi:hypothetical protein